MTDSEFQQYLQNTGLANPQQSQPQPQEPQSGNSFLNMINRLGGDLGVQKFGQGIATARLVNNSEDDQAGNQNAAELEQSIQMAKMLHNPKTTPEQKQRILQHFQQVASGQQQDFNEGDIDQGTNLSNREVLGSALSTASLVAGGEFGGDALTEAADSGVMQGIKSGALAGLESGAMAGAGEGIQDNNASVGQIVKKTLKGGLTGAVTGGIFGGATGAIGEGYRALKRGFAPSELSSEEATALEAFRPPRMSTDEQAIAAKEGRARVTGANKQITYMPSKSEQRISEALQPMVNDGRIVKPQRPEDYLRNIKNVQDELTNSTTNLRQELKNVKLAKSWSLKDFQKTVFDTPAPEGLAVKDRKAVQNAFFTALQKTDGKTSNAEPLLDVRQNFDDELDKKYPNLYNHTAYNDSKLADIRSYVSDVRSKINDFTAQQLPDGKLSNGVSYRDELRRQSSLIKANEGMAQKFAEDNPAKSTAYQRWAKEHPEMARLTRYLVRATVIGTALGGSIYTLGPRIAKSLQNK